LGGQLLFPMYARASTILLEQATPDLLLPAIKKHQASIVFTSPTAYRFLLAKLQDGDLSSVRTCVSAGETLPKPTWDSWKEKTGLEILDGIGSTSCFIFSCLHVQMIFVRDQPENRRKVIKRRWLMIPEMKSRREQPENLP